MMKCGRILYSASHKSTLTSAPTLSLSPTTPMTASMKTYGTKSAISESGDFSVTAAAISVARVTASSRVCGLSFQFPLMMGVRAISKESDIRGATPKVGANAPAEPTRERKESAVNFIVDFKVQDEISLALKI